MRRCLYLIVIACLSILLAYPLSLSAQVTFAVVRTDEEPIHVVRNPSTNQIYTLNRCGLSQECGDTTTGSVTVVDGNTFATSRVWAGAGTVDMQLNPTTNTVYVVNQVCDPDPVCQQNGTVTVINGSTLATQTVTVGLYPESAAVDPVRNKIYVANSGSQTITVIDGATLTTQDVSVSDDPALLAVNPRTNQIYAVNHDSTIAVYDGAGFSSHLVGTTYVSPAVIQIDLTNNKAYVAYRCPQGSCDGPGAIVVVDGNNFSSQQVGAGIYPDGLAINSATNKIYVTNQCADPQCNSNGTLTIIDGSTLSETSLPLPLHPFSVDVDSQRNRIFAAGSIYCDSCLHGTLLSIDGSTLSMFPIDVGSSPDALAVDASSDRVYVAAWATSSISVVGADTKLQFANMNPCRLVDTRTTHDPIQGGDSRDFVIPQLGNCNVPSTAVVYSLNVTVVPHGRLGYLTIWPGDDYQPTVSTLNSFDGRIKANAAIVTSGISRAVSVYASDTTDLILDINGYFTPSDPQTSEFYPLTPCRVVDTRGDNGNLGGPYLSGGVERDFPISTSHCVPSGPAITGYSFNITADPHVSGQHLGYLTVWPQGQERPVVSTLNNPTGTVVANAAVVPAGDEGGVAVYPSQDTDLIIDIDGYFAAPGANGLSLYPTFPCRVLDTRTTGGGQPFSGEITVDVAANPCGPPAVSQAYLFNVTAIPTGSLGYLTLWPDGENMPLASTLNARDGSVASNMAIVPTTNGSIDAYASGLTQLLLDISGYFAP